MITDQSLKFMKAKDSILVNCLVLGYDGTNLSYHEYIKKSTQVKVDQAQINIYHTNKAHINTD